MADLEMEIQPLEQVQQGILVRLQGAIDAKSIPSFQERLDELREEGYISFVLDMNGVKYVNSTGLGYLVQLADQLRPQNGQMVLVRVQPKVRVVFDMLGLNSFFQIYSSNEQALEKLGSAAGAPAAATAEPEELLVEEEEIPVLEELPDSAEELIVDRSAEAPLEVEELVPAADEIVLPELEGGELVIEEEPAPAAAPALVEEPAPAAPPAPPGPSTLKCESCAAPLQVPQKGHYKCPRCAAAFQYLEEGAPKFLPRRPTSAFTLTMNGSSTCIKTLSTFGAELAQEAGFSVQEVQGIRYAIQESVMAMVQHAYKGNQDCLYHVMVVSGPKELRLTLTGYGEKVNPNGTDASGKPLFGYTKQVMNLFDLRAHPHGGNILTIGRKR